mgnify:CR=1 FL=1
MITLGTQNSLFLLTSLLADQSVTFGVENPGYGNLRHVISLCDSHVRRMRRTYEKKWLQMQQGIERYLSHCEIHSTAGSFCFCLGLPNGISSHKLRDIAAQHGILIESGDTLFMQQDAPKNYIRLGFSAINTDKILEGLAILGGLITKLKSVAS